jgi:hypothetical protein
MPVSINSNIDPLNRCPCEKCEERRAAMARDVDVIRHLAGVTPGWVELPAPPPLGFLGRIKARIARRWLWWFHTGPAARAWLLAAKECGLLDWNLGVCGCQELNRLRGAYEELPEGDQLVINKWLRIILPSCVWERPVGSRTTSDPALAPFSEDAIKNAAARILGTPPLFQLLDSAYEDVTDPPAESS